MQRKKQSNPERKKTYIICLNPHCTLSDERCLDAVTLHKHPSDCSKFYYPAESIVQNWEKVPEYPNDPLGKSLLKKFKISGSKSFVDSILNDIRKQCEQLLDRLEEDLNYLFPTSFLQQKYEQVYSLERVSAALRQNNSPTFITGLINAMLSKAKYKELFSFNQKLDELHVSLQTTFAGFKQKINQLVSQNKKKEEIKNAFPENWDNKIHYGLIKSKYIWSNKIICENGVVTFPKIENIGSFLPWLYTERMFSTGMHEIKLCCLKFPNINNCGLLVLEDHDIDTYPYHYFKSIYSKEGKSFELTQGSQIQHIVPEVTTISLKLNLGTNPTAEIYDSERRSVYVCSLRENRSYRMGIYGSGWCVRVLELY